MKKILLASAIALILNACSDEANNNTSSAASSSTPAIVEQPANSAPEQKPVLVQSAELGEWGIDLEQMDSSIEPGDDFARYVNGVWLDTFEIPADRATYGIFTALRERSTRQVNEIITELAEMNAAAGSVEQKVRDYYGTWMDLDAMNAAGAEPLKPYLDAIAAISDEKGLMLEFSKLHSTAPFGVGIIPDPADTTKYTLFAGQAGLGMPDREYYLSEDEKYVEIRSVYTDYMTQIMELAGIDNAGEKAAGILAVETRLAEVHWTPAESRDIKKIYNPMSPEKLAEIAPEFDWKLILAEQGLGGVDNIIVAQPSAITESGKIVKDVPLDTWKDYLAYHFIRNNAASLSEAFDDANFGFFSKTLNGIEEKRERWKRGSDLVNNNMGEAVGQIYVKRHFPPESKAMMDELVVNLRDSLEERINENEWMDAETKQQALVKLDTFEPRIGYTSKWIDYSTLEIKAGDMLGNSLRVNEFAWQQQLERLGGPVDRELWPYPPQTVNASYNPLLNQITFPAGILQPPFFDPMADPAVNYGAIGGVIGHEIGHGFDDQGRRFDEKGLIRDWWTEASDKAFKERSGNLTTQYNGYSPLDGMHIDGELTLGENIGDLGGLEMAYSAYQRHKAKHGEPPVLDGFTGDQRFFMSWAQVWRAKYRDEAMRQRLLTDPHSPPEYRINGVVRNMDAWYKAFDVKENDQMYLQQDMRVSIW